MWNHVEPCGTAFLLFRVRKNTKELRVTTEKPLQRVSYFDAQVSEQRSGHVCGGRPVRSEAGAGSRSGKPQRDSQSEGAVDVPELTW